MGLKVSLLAFDFNEAFEELWKNRLTKYEIARIISARALQISMGAIPLIDVSPDEPNDSISIAEKELKRDVLPITIRRRLPNGKVIVVSLRNVKVQ
ncbi:DNA-directed RNA polymerase subunit K [Sulfuracidifex metallicus DSM 6482 = JCM 9184]|jgi:DNA-directed RNA polymerase subunit K|uniref:DNA-directed RNA polymerase subunit Rpo6 n=1 Tax=Sulfuracidifex metallicus DSM 6482 = JCM 9184 TaxID=523847 RepID=A0A6A9QL83_SULME|nr:DNA-directed RNA polymerase subunit K [Sulfuracidifex metallicus]MCY0850908.1 DNA-directed RNA polymerase subunit K [Sulfuracidifex metallicus]MUN27931.1 DNA-directed RNA polymerase subunit K [Sulfuracidifex metallicus DSM 6482 = JCM 9184]WOE51515.1 DNA-directed RNA polymerase subunit K [Sulfuracidifex metallicus DSM 6482 = JCM 9184]